MKTYIALLRGINVSGQKKIKMAELKTHLEELNYKNVRTYIQSGNVIFEHEAGKPQHLEKEIEKIIVEKYGFEVPTIVKSPSELEYVLKHNPFLNDPGKDIKRMYVTFLSAVPSAAYIGQLDNINHSPEEFILEGQHIWFYSPDSYSNAKMNNNFFEGKLKVHATTRNWRTVNKLLEIANCDGR